MLDLEEDQLEAKRKTWLSDNLMDLSSRSLHMSLIYLFSFSIFIALRPRVRQQLRLAGKTTRREHETSTSGLVCSLWLCGFQTS